MNNPHTIYQARILHFTQALDTKTRQRQYLPAARLTLFGLGAWLMYQYFHDGSDWQPIAVAGCFIVFLFIRARDLRILAEIEVLEQLLKINQQEVAALSGDYSAFDPGNEFIQFAHPYAYDLDVFGQQSMFQSLNRTATVFGKQRLADYCQNAYAYASEVLSRQTAVQELANEMDFRQELQRIFYAQKIALADQQALQQWLESPSPIQRPGLLKILAYGLPTITILAIVGSMFGLLPFPTILIISQLLIVNIYSRQTLQTHQTISAQSQILKKYAEALSLLERKSWESPFLQELKNRLESDAHEQPSQAIHRLAKLLNYMDSNLNMLAAIVLNGLFLFNLHLLMQVEQWRVQHRQAVMRWFEVIGDMEAMNSLATFAANHPDYHYPTPVTGEFSLEAENMGHPMIPKDQCVLNSLHIDGWNQFLIITGANMAGKSTFLRTIGTNYWLAMTGAPVWASKFAFTPIQLHSSIRTNDSLAKKESYFYAELKRLKQIIDELEAGQQKFILLDEILKGTNSKDKQNGSLALIEQLLRYRSVGLFATHDLVLGNLAQAYPKNVHNYCFEINIVGDQMQIDYRLQPGVCKNLNATFLMKNMGILIDKAADNRIV